MAISSFDSGAAGRNVRIVGSDRRPLFQPGSASYNVRELNGAPSGNRELRLANGSAGCTAAPRQRLDPERALPRQPLRSLFVGFAPRLRRLLGGRNT
jgi:hypothetical protein